MVYDLPFYAHADERCNLALPQVYLVLTRHHQLQKP